MRERGKVYNKIFSKEDWEKVNEFNKHILDDFLTELKARKKSQGTIKQYNNDLRIIFIYILKYLNNKNITELNRKHFRNLSLWLVDELKVSSSRCNRLLSATRSLLNFIEEDDDYDYEVNCATKIKSLKKETVREIYFLTDEQIELLYKELIKREKYLHALYLSLSYDSGARRNECYQVMKDGLLGKNYTNKVVGKRGKKFPLLYFDRTQEALQLYFVDRGYDELPELWVTKINNTKRPIKYNTLYSYMVEMADILAEIAGEYIPFNPHSLRHSALENMRDGSHYICKKLGKTDGFSLEELKVFANHNSTQTTEGYLKNRDKDILEGMFGITIK